MVLVLPASEMEIMRKTIRKMSRIRSRPIRMTGNHHKLLTAQMGSRTLPKVQSNDPGKASQSNRALEATNSMMRQGYKHRLYSYLGSLNALRTPIKTVDQDRLQGERQNQIQF